MREPVNTCPEIDEVQEDLCVISAALHDLAEEIYKRGYHKHMVAALEKLRTQNEQLRKWGSYWKEKALGNATDRD